MLIGRLLIMTLLFSSIGVEASNNEAILITDQQKSRFARHSSIKDDEHVVFFRTSAVLDTKNNSWRIPIHGWIYEPQHSVIRKAAFAKILKEKYNLTTTPGTQRNFDQRLNLLITDNERNKLIVIDIAGQQYRLPPSKENGHFSTELVLPVTTVEAHAINNTLTFSAITSPSDHRNFNGEVILLKQTGISVISDIDDTIKISNVTEHKKLLESTFLQAFASVPGMAKKYQQWEKNNIAIHFVSSSPWQLYTPLQAFTDKAGFPASTFNLKNVRFLDSTLFNLFKKGTDTKPLQIEPILKAYPDRKFVLIGDSGEYDPEVYARIKKLYPDQILKIYIRNISDETINNERFKPLLSDLDTGILELFTDPSTLTIPSHPKLKH